MTAEKARVENGTKPVGFWEAFWFWVKLGFINFGGPAGQIAIMHRELVERKRWVSEKQYLRTLNFCMLLPGPEAQQVATYIGWRLHGTLGGIVAGGLFLIPSMFVLVGLSYLPDRSRGIVRCPAKVQGSDLPYGASRRHCRYGMDDAIAGRCFGACSVPRARRTHLAARRATYRSLAHGLQARGPRHIASRPWLKC